MKLTEIKKRWAKAKTIGPGRVFIPGFHGDPRKDVQALIAALESSPTENQRPRPQAKRSPVYVPSKTPTERPGDE